MNLEHIPTDSGCYIYKDAAGKIIYIGKAKNLKKRVSSYFQKKDHDPKTNVLINKIDSFEYIITQNEKESLILENNLIKKHQPKYNIDLKDSKRYAYIMLTKELFPRALVARDKTQVGDYFGPFTSAEDRDTLLRFTNNIFQIRTCKKLPKRVCLRFHMGLCSAPCIGNVTEKEYTLQVEHAKELLLGKEKELSTQLKIKMYESSQRQEYEQAKILRDKIEAIERVSERQSVEKTKEYDQDVIHYIVHEQKVHLAIFHVNKGILFGKSEFTFPETEDFFEEFIVQFYANEKIPKEIIVPIQMDESIDEYLSELKGTKAECILPLKGERKELLNLVYKNIEKSFFEDVLALTDLKEKLFLPTLPKVIECFDISHFSGTNTVASMVQFVNGKPEKSGYRRFKIKTVDGIDDFASIAEVVLRRYKRLQEEEKEMPDLIVIDGGKGQLSSACESLKELNIKISIISLAKRNEEVYFPGLSTPKEFDKKSRALQLLQRLRDEAHRFAITYQKLLRNKRVLEKK